MASVNDFASILGFSEDDLVLNREGRLSERQIAARKQTARSGAMGCLWIVGVVFGMSVFFLFTFNMPSISGAGLPSGLSNPNVLIPGILALLSGGLVLLALRSAYFPLTPTLGRLTGTIVRGNVTPNKKVYEVEINGRGFKVPQAAYELIDTAKIYTVYSADIQYDRLTVYSKDDNNHIMAIEEAQAADADEAKSPIEYAQQQFRRVFQFSDAELEANRAGNLSQGQVAMLSSGSRNDVVMWIILAGGGAMLPLVLVGIGTQNLLLIVLGIGLFLLLMFLFTRSSKGSQRKLAKALRSGAAKADGTAKAWITQIKHHSSRRSWTETVYHIQVGEVKFKVKENAYYAFKDGSAYCVYYVKGLGNKIVSAEQVG